MNENIFDATCLVEEDWTYKGTALNFESNKVVDRTNGHFETWFQILQNIVNVILLEGDNYSIVNININYFINFLMITIDTRMYFIGNYLELF